MAIVMFSVSFLLTAVTRMSYSQHSELEGEVKSLGSVEGVITKANKPFSLQHLALAATVKCAIKAATPSRYRECVKFDIPLFDELKILDTRGLRILNCEFAVNVDNYCWLCVPFHKLISKWENRFWADSCVIFEPGVFCWYLVDHIDSLTPFCNCRVLKEENIPNPKNSQDDYSEYVARYDGNGLCSRSKIAGLLNPTYIRSPDETTCVNGHTMQCNWKEFRYQ